MIAALYVETGGCYFGLHGVDPWDEPRDASKATWLYAAHVDLPSLIWGKVEQRIHPRALELHGYEKARRIGMMAMVGGKDKTRIREATPEPFRDLLLSIAATAKPERLAA